MSGWKDGRLHSAVLISPRRERRRDRRTRRAAASALLAKDRDVRKAAAKAKADELAAEGKNGEEIAADLEVSAATLYNWRRQYGGMDADAAKELKELREQNGRLKRLLADAELEKDALREIAKGKF